MLAKNLIPFLDLTLLEETATSSDIEALCQQAATPFGLVKAVCVYSQHLPIAKKAIPEGVRLATVVNFPKGTASLPELEQEVKKALAAGADEIDAVLPYEDFLSGDRDGASLVINMTRIWSFKYTLKVILESGVFTKQEDLCDAAEIALLNGADFIKTSTGKISAGASPEAVQTILKVIGKYPDRRCGIKISGGVRTIDQAFGYFSQIRKTAVPSFINSDRIRFGASQLLTEILADPEREAPWVSN